MADSKISALTALNNADLAADDVLPIVDTGAVATKKISVADLMAGSPSNPSVQQTDIGTAPNEIPLNQYLGSMAYQSLENVVVENISYTGILTGSTGVINIGSGQVFKDASGNVGIGTSSPAVKFHIAGTGNRAARIDSTNGGSTALGFYAGATDIAGISANVGAANLVFAVSATERMRIDSAGNVGIGTNAPSSKLMVEGTFAVGNGVSGAIVYATTGALTLGSTAAEAVVLRTNSAERARIDSSGNLIQTVNTTAATLTTNQTLTFSIVDNSTLRISVRGSDGTTRTATLPLL